MTQTHTSAAARRRSTHTIPKLLLLATTLLLTGCIGFENDTGDSVIAWTCPNSIGPSSGVGCTDLSTDGFVEVGEYLQVPSTGWLIVVTSASGVDGCTDVHLNQRGPNEILVSELELGPC